MTIVHYMSVSWSVLCKPSYQKLDPDEHLPEFHAADTGWRQPLGHISHRFFFLAAVESSKILTKKEEDSP